MKELVLRCFHLSNVHNVLGHLCTRDEAKQAMETAEKENEKLFLYSVNWTRNPNDDVKRIKSLYAFMISPQRLLDHDDIDNEEIDFFISETNLASIFPIDLDGDIIHVSDVYDNEKVPMQIETTGFGDHIIVNPKLFELSDYAFDRDYFTKLFKLRIGADDEIYSEFESFMTGTDDGNVGNFRLWIDEDEEVRMLHIPSGTIIGWYKLNHWGRANFCNKKDFTLKDLDDFLILLRDQIKEQIQKDKPEYHPKTKVTEEDMTRYQKKIIDNSIYGMTAVDVPSMYPSVEEKENDKNESKN